MTEQELIDLRNSLSTLNTSLDSALTRIDSLEAAAIPKNHYLDQMLAVFTDHCGCPTNGTGGGGNAVTYPSYVVFRFFWELTGGSDLEGRGLISSPIITEQSSVGDNTQPTYVSWSGDVSGLREEYVVINIGQVITDFPNETSIVINCLSYWFNGSVGLGDFSVDFKAYTGGTVEQNQSTGAYSVIGGTEVFTQTEAFLSVASGNNIASATLNATLTYNKTANTFTVNIPQV